MRVTKYLRSDGENWVVARIRHSPHLMSGRLDDLLAKNGWIKWDRLRERFNKLKKRVAKSNPTKFPNWKEVKIPTRTAVLTELPAGIHKDVQLLDQHGQPFSASESTPS